MTPSDAPLDPPTTARGRLRHVGPGIIVSGSIVGSGELIVTTKLGAEVGFALLWLILFSCFVKVFLQIELGRWVVSSGRTVLDALDRVPGPAVRVGAGRINWLNALWAVMAFCSIVQLGGILTALVAVAALPALGLQAVEPWVVSTATVLLTAGLLVAGRYRLVERATTGMVCVFTLLTVVAVVCLQRTGFAMGAGELTAGLVPTIPPTGVLTAFAVLGITGVGASELIYYPYWCLEKGYARYAGPPDGSTAWLQRAQGWIAVMKVDAWCACVVYTTGTVAFYLLGAAVLHRQGRVPQKEDLHPALSGMYEASFGTGAGPWLYAAGAVAVLFSTFFVATASNARVVADSGRVFGVTASEAGAQRRLVRVLCVAMPVFCWVIATFVGKPVRLVMVGAVAQAALLPFLSYAVVWLRYRATLPALVQRSWADAFLWLAIASTALIGGYQLYDVFDSWTAGG